MWYDVSIFIVEFAILIAVLAEAWISWQALQEKRKTKIRRTVSRLLRTLNVPTKKK